MPIYANTPTAPCQQCRAENSLRLNPLIIGPLHDEHASLSPSRLIWSDAAYTQLLGHTPSQLSRLALLSSQSSSSSSIEERKKATEKLSWIEDRLQWLRVTLVVGWNEETGRGRVGICGVRGD